VYYIASRKPRRLLGLGGLLTVSVFVFGAAPVAQATHIGGGSNGHQGTAAVVGNDNLETRVTAFFHGSCGFSTTDGVAACGASGGVGVRGYTPDGTGVVGVGATGVYANAESNSGTALDVDGKAKFSRSGETSINAGFRKKNVSMRGLTTRSLVVATIQGRPIRGLHVVSVQVFPARNRFTIHLSKAVPAGTTATVGWFIAN
jgi:hypothetical protein